MSPKDHRIDELVRQGQELRRRGVHISVEILCYDCPELADELRQRLEDVPTVQMQGTSDVNRPKEPRPVIVNLQPGFEPVPGYRLVQRLGSGGFGEVWEALAPGGIPVALKFVVLATKGITAEQRSLDIIKNLRHPNLVSTIGSWRTDKHLVIAMELADNTLWERFEVAVDQGLPGIPRDELLEYLHEAAKGIDFLNEPRHGLDGTERGRVQHRDIKPQNILLVGGGVKVADFGLARLLEHTVTGHTGSMTPHYAAPEFFNRHTEQHSDQYSLAITYCQMRGGRLPFRGSHAEVMHGHLTKLPDLSMLPPEEQPIVARALSKNSTQRWPSCLAFVNALRASTTQIPQLPPTVNRWLFLGPTILGGSALVLLVVSISDWPGGRLPARPIITKVTPANNSVPVRESASETPSPPSVPDTPTTNPTVVKLREEPRETAETEFAAVSALTVLSSTVLTKPSDQEPSMVDHESAKQPMLEKPTKSEPPADALKLDVAIKDKPIITAAVVPAPSPKPTQSSLEKAIVSTSTGIKLVLIPAGEFDMGSSEADIVQLVRDVSDFKKENAEDEQPAHRVKISQAFYMGQSEVTKGQFGKFVAAEKYRTEAEKDGQGGWGYNPVSKKFEGRNPQYTWKSIGWAPYADDHPVVNVTWNDAKAFCRWLSEKENKVYRLPTEAEWEYACRAGTKTRHPAGDQTADLVRIANIADQSAKRISGISQNVGFAEINDGFECTAPVRSFTANEFGLYDMIGNVWEWCEDVYDPTAYRSRSEITVDPVQMHGSDHQVLRGGSWYFTPREARSAVRHGDARNYRSSNFGFRVVCVSPGTKTP